MASLTGQRVHYIPIVTKAKQQAATLDQSHKHKRKDNKTVQNNNLVAQETAIPVCVDLTKPPPPTLQQQNLTSKESCHSQSQNNHFLCNRPQSNINQ